MLTLAINRETVSMISIQPKAAHLPSTRLEAYEMSEVGRELAAIQAVLAGNADAFKPLIEANQTRVYSLALRMLGNEREAEDVAQDAFLHAYARLATYNPAWRFKTWIMTITSNLCIDRLRRRKLEPVSFTDYAQRDGEASDEIEFVSHAPQPDAVVAQRQRDDDVRAMLHELPAEDRSMVVMFYFNDMSYEEIANAKSTTVGAVKSRLFRARQKMAQSKWAEGLL